MKNKERYNEIISFVPQTKEDKIDWEGLENTALQHLFSALKGTEQSPYFHSEGNVFEHTKLVCNALVAQDDYLAESEEGKIILFLGALFHDLGKTTRTKVEEGRIVSPGHAFTGSFLTRKFFWKELL